MKEESNKIQINLATENNKNTPLPPLNLENQIVIEDKTSKQNGDYKHSQYVRGTFLGKGGFAKCYELTRVYDRKLVAGKIITKATLAKSRARQKLLSEIKIHRSLLHRHVVGFEHFFEDCENVYILLELCKNQSLNELLKRRKRLHELEVQCYTIQIVQALKYMHGHKVIHRDLKLGNLFLNDKMEVKIGDFGLATRLEFEGDKKKTICGTPNYIAPEILEGKSGHSYEVDIWSLGVIIFTLLFGKPPFETSDVKSTYQRIKKNQYQFPENIKVSKQSKELITSILVLDPSKRLTLDQILDHEFFHLGKSIPKNLPVSTLACPPSEKYLRQYWPTLGRQGSQPDIHYNNTITANKENQVQLRDGIMTERDIHNNRVSTLSPQSRDAQRNNPEMNIKINQNWDVNDEPFITKYVDYSNKYGIAYKMNNGNIGVYFNDNSKMLLFRDNYSFNYYEKGSDKIEKQATFNFNNYKQELQKKVTLLQHFQKYLQDQQELSQLTNMQSNNIPEFNNVYVKKWMRTKHAILFRLSNKLVQVNFEDNSQLVMSSISKKVFYQNKKGEQFHYLLATALDSGNQELIKRLNYARQVLEHTLRQPTQKMSFGNTLSQRSSSNQTRSTDVKKSTSDNHQRNISSPSKNNNAQPLTSRTGRTNQNEFSPYNQNQQSRKHLQMIDKKQNIIATAI